MHVRSYIAKFGVIALMTFSFILISMPAVYSQSAWLASHFMAKKIDMLPSGEAVITAYPLLSTINGLEPYPFDSYTQIITGKGKYHIQLNIIHDSSGHLCETINYDIEATYDGCTSGHLSRWSHLFKDSGWYRLEITCSPLAQPPELIGTFYFYQAVELK